MNAGRVYTFIYASLSLVYCRAFANNFVSKVGLNARCKMRARSCVCSSVQCLCGRFISLPLSIPMRPCLGIIACVRVVVSPPSPASLSPVGTDVAQSAELANHSLSLTCSACYLIVFVCFAFSLPCVLYGSTFRDHFESFSCVLTSRVGILCLFVARLSSHLESTFVR